MSTSATRRLVLTVVDDLASTTRNKTRRACCRFPIRQRLVSTAATAAVCYTAERFLSETRDAPRSRRLKYNNQESSSSLPLLSSMKHEQRRFFASSNGKAGQDDPSLLSSSPGKASITFAGEPDEAETKGDADDKFDVDAYTIPIVIEMPPMDDVGGDESHCFVEAWHKKEGDWVRPEDVLCDVSTPDFVFGMQIDDSELGLLKEIHVQENVRVPDHTPLCTIYHKATPAAAATTTPAAAEAVETTKYDGKL